MTSRSDGVETILTLCDEGRMGCEISRRNNIFHTTSTISVEHAKFLIVRLGSSPAVDVRRGGGLSCRFPSGLHRAHCSLLCSAQVKQHRLVIGLALNTSGHFL